MSSGTAVVQVDRRAARFAMRTAFAPSTVSRPSRFRITSPSWATRRTATPDSSRGRRAPHDGSDLVEGNGEDVVQHEREPLGGSQSVEHQEQREADRIGQQCSVLGVGCVLAAHARVDVTTGWILGS